MALRKTGGYSRAKGEGLYWESGLAEEKKAGNRGESCPDTETQKLAQRYFLEQIGMEPELADRFEARLEELKPPPGPWIEDPPPPPLPPTLWQRLRAGRIWAAGYARTGQRRLQKLLDERAHTLLLAAGAVILGLLALVLVLLFA